MSDGIPCMWMRGGTSKGGYFLVDNLPTDTAKRDAVLLLAMGSPDVRQIDGMGGADPLTSKVAVVRKSTRVDVDVDYLFLQVFVDQPIVTDAQNCGNILAGVGPFAIERGLVAANNGETPVSIYMENTGQIAVAKVQTPNSVVSYTGEAQIDGVPGQEEPEDLEANTILLKKLEKIRLACGFLMNLGDVSSKTVPKMTMVSAAQDGGAISTRTFIPHRCHKTIGVLGAVSVATACLIKSTTAYDLAQTGQGHERKISVEHPTGEMTVVVSLDENGTVTKTAILRTTRKLMDGEIFV